MLSSALGPTTWGGWNDSDRIADQRRAGGSRSDQGLPISIQPRDRSVRHGAAALRILARRDGYPYGIQGHHRRIRRLGRAEAAGHGAEHAYDWKYSAQTRWQQGVR